jgi:hypothetical protein
MIQDFKTSHIILKAIRVAKFTVVDLSDRMQIKIVTKTVQRDSVDKTSAEKINIKISSSNKITFQAGPD